MFALVLRMQRHMSLLRHLNAFTILGEPLDEHLNHLVLLGESESCTREALALHEATMAPTSAALRLFAK